MFIAKRLNIDTENIPREKYMHIRIKEIFMILNIYWSIFTDFNT